MANIEINDYGYLYEINHNTMNHKEILKRIKSLERRYMFYKKMHESLKRLLDDDSIDLQEFWDIVSKYYTFDLFFSNETIEDCERLGIDYKRLKTDYLLYKRIDDNIELYNEDWIILDKSNNIDTRKVYNDSEINELLDKNEMTVLSTYYQRKAPKKFRCEYVPEFEDFNIYCDKKIIESSYCSSLAGEMENITYNNNYARLESRVYENPIIKEKIRENVFTKEKITEDMDYCRFRALQILKLIKNNCNILDDVILEERQILTKEM